MTDDDAIQMMSRCLSEIKQLRTTNNEIAPFARAYETIEILTRLLAPPSSQGYSEDIVYKLEREIEKLRKENSDG